MREIVRAVQSARKEAGLEVDSRINLSFATSSTILRNAISLHTSEICKETLATEVEMLNGEHFEKTVKVGGEELKYFSSEVSIAT